MLSFKLPDRSYQRFPQRSLLRRKGALRTRYRHGYPLPVRGVAPAEIEDRVQTRMDARA